MTMFSPGFRLFFGFFITGLVAMTVYGLSSGGDGALSIVGVASLGWKGGIGDHVGYIGLFFFTLSALFVGCMLVWFRDADPESVADLSPEGVAPAIEAPVGHSFWPAVGAFGIGVAIIGLVVHAAIFVVGLVILAAVFFEWLVGVWSDHISSDQDANRAIRNRIMGPIEIPVLSVVGVAALVLAFSQVLLAVSKEQAVWVALAVSIVVFGTIILYTMFEEMPPNLVAGLIVVGAVGCLVAGIVAASIGIRDFEHHEEHDDHSEEAALVVYE